MNQRTLEAGMVAVAVAFTAAFVAVVIPALMEDGDVFGAFAAGFVNPYSTGYSIDVLLCWLALAIWILHDRKRYSIKHGYVCLLLGVVPGVAVGLPLYIVLRGRQITESVIDQSSSTAPSPNP